MAPFYVYEIPFYCYITLLVDTILLSLRLLHVAYCSTYTTNERRSKRLLVRESSEPSTHPRYTVGRRFKFMFADNFHKQRVVSSRYTKYSDALWNDNIRN
jgi:hypothetical protein